MMTNDKKREYIKQWYSLLLKYKNETDVSSATVKIQNEFIRDLAYKQPQKVYRYCACSKNKINNFKNGKEWFSSAKHFNDLIDFTMNLDLEKQQEELKKDKYAVGREIARKLAKIYKQDPSKITMDMVRKCTDLYNDDLKKFIIDNTSFRDLNNEEIIKLNNDANDLLKESSDVINFAGETYINLNEMNVEKVSCLCLTDSPNNNKMWHEYAKEETGFCIEYSIPISEDNIQYRMFMFPMLYGTRESISLKDFIIEGIESEALKQKGIPENHRFDKQIQCLFTKDISWSTENEWRIISTIFGEQNFSFATAIYLGARINPHNAKILTNIAMAKNISVYRRQLNATKSSIIVEKIN